MVMIGLVGAGAMGSALGASWQAGGVEVVTCLTGRSARTHELAARAGLTILATTDEVLRADLVVSVVPPAHAVEAAQGIADAAARAGTAPLVADLNAVAPSTVRDVAGVLRKSGIDLVDGSISGLPPAAGRQPTRMYLSGERAGELAAIASPWTSVTVLDGDVGQASALKMCTASMYKGTNALVMQAMLTAHANGVLDAFLADVAAMWPDRVASWHLDIALAATKSGRFADEMREIARAQADAGLPGELFHGVAAAFEWAAGSRLGHTAPERLPPSASVAEVLAGFAPGDCAWPA